MERHKDLAPKESRKKKKPILFIIGQYHPVIGGAETQAKKLAARLRSLDCKVEVLTIHRWGLRLWENVSGIPVRRVAPLSFGNIKVLMARLSMFLYILLHSRKYTCLHAHGGNGLATVAVLAGRITGLPVVVKMVNSGDRFDLSLLASRNGMGKYYANILIKGATQFIATTPQIQQELKESGVAEDRIRLIPNGVEISEGYKESSGDRLRIMVASRLVKQKNIAFLINVLAKADFPYHLYIHGEGPELNSLHTIVSQYGMEERVKFVGLSDQDTVSTALAKADLFVNPSLVEGLSNLLLEAMSAGTPVLVSDLPSNQFVLGDDLAFSCCLPLVTDLWVERLKKLHGDPANRQRVGIQVRSRVASFDMVVIAEKYLSMYRQIGVN